MCGAGCKSVRIEEKKMNRSLASLVGFKEGVAGMRNTSDKV